MGKGQEPFLNRQGLLETLSELPEVSVERPQPAYLLCEHCPHQFKIS